MTKREAKEQIDQTNRSFKMELGYVEKKDRALVDLHKDGVNRSTKLISSGS